MVKDGDDIAVWFSCGAASAVAAKLTLEHYKNCQVRILNSPVMEEDEDNRRFLGDVERWLGKEIEIVTSKNFPSQSAREVWEKKKFMSSVAGAPCTSELKKKARQEWESKNKVDWHVLGFTHEEKDRADRFMLTERDNLIPILIDHKVSKVQCMEIIASNGIEVPRVYKMGYPNANCIGCVKATSPTYWNLVRETHPEVFEDRAKQSRDIGARLTRVRGERLFLDELKPTDVGAPIKDSYGDCGLFCEEIK